MTSLLDRAWPTPGFPAAQGVAMRLPPSSRTAFWPLLVAARGSRGSKAAAIVGGLAASFPYEFGQKTVCHMGKSFYIFSGWFYSSKGSTNIFDFFFTSFFICFNRYEWQYQVASKFTKHSRFSRRWWLDHGWASWQRYFFLACWAVVTGMVSRGNFMGFLWWFCYGLNGQFVG